MQQDPNLIHLRYSGMPFEVQRRAFLEIVWDDALVREALTRARSLDLRDWLLVSGALYNAVWNNLTGKPPGHGTKDFDLFYFDRSDLSWEVEDSVIKRADACFSDFPLPVEVRNQARVHLWYERRFGQPYPQLSRSQEALRLFASRTHAVGIRCGAGDALDLVAPFGLDDIFSFRITPNRALDNHRTHEEKAARAKTAWPEITVVPW